MARATNTSSRASVQEYLYLLMHLDAAPLGADGEVLVAITEPTIAESYHTSQITTFSATGTDSKEAFKQEFTSLMEEEDSNLFTFVGDAFDGEAPLFVWVFAPGDRAWVFLGEIKPEKTVNYELIGG